MPLSGSIDPVVDHPQGDTQQQCVLSRGTETATVNLVGRDGRWQQFNTPCSLIMPLSGSIDPVVDHPQGDTQQQCVLSRAQKQPQSTW